MSDEHFGTCASHSSMSQGLHSPKSQLSRMDKSYTASLAFSSSWCDSDVPIATSIATLRIRVDNLEESFHDSLNILTDRLNRIEAECEISREVSNLKIASVQGIVKQLFTKLVRKLITILQSSRPSRPVYSRIGIQRAMGTPPRE